MNLAACSYMKKCFHISSIDIWFLRYAISLFGTLTLNSILKCQQKTPIEGKKYFYEEAWNFFNFEVLYRIFIASWSTTGFDFENKWYSWPKLQSNWQFPSIISKNVKSVEKSF